MAADQVRPVAIVWCLLIVVFCVLQGPFIAFTVFSILLIGN
jgi:hypothetical protein